jgi:hypothetical protein
VLEPRTLLEHAVGVSVRDELKIQRLLTFSFRGPGAGGAGFRAACERSPASAR